MIVTLGTIKEEEVENRALAMDQSWRTGLAHSRNKIVNRIMDTLQRHAPVLGRQDSVIELWEIANRFEERIFYAASDQHEYLQKISIKLLNLESMTQNASNGALTTSSNGTNSVRPFTTALSQLQSRQQVVYIAQGGLLANGIQGGPVLRFSSTNNVTQPAPVMNALGQVSGSLPALNGGSLGSTGAGQAPSQSLHSQSVLLTSQQRIAQMQQARKQQQGQQQQQQQQQQQAQQHVSAAVPTQPGGSVQQQPQAQVTIL